MKIEQPTSKSGTADVDWNHGWRKAYQNNDDYLRSPKYMCQPGVSGKVVVRVKVNSNGNVTSATSLTTGIDPCLIETAIAYAYKSRFEPSSKSVDEGTVTYTYYP
jgi:TonB family protein